MAEASTSQLQACIDRLNARGELIGRACERLRRLTRRMLPPDDRLRRFEDTDDVLQNAALRLWRALESVPLTSVAEFLRLAAWHIRNELRDLARHHYGSDGSGARRATPQQAVDATGTFAPASEPADTTHDPRRLAAWRDFHEQVERLPEEARQVFDLLWYQDLTQTEAAEMLQVSVPTVKRRWLSARLRLREALKDQLPEG